MLSHHVLMVPTGYCCWHGVLGGCGSIFCLGAGIFTVDVERLNLRIETKCNIAKQHIKKETGCYYTSCSQSLLAVLVHKVGQCRLQIMTGNWEAVFG